MNIEDIKNKIRKSDNIGLFYGKTGASIASFILQNKKLGLDKQFAEELLTDVLDKISDNMPLNISCGLSGVGLGINFLIQKEYVEGNSDNVLKDVDDLIFKKIVYYNNNDKIDCVGLCDILYYTLVRLKTGLKNKMERTVFEEFAKKMINLIYIGRNIDFFEEPLPYNIYYPLPCFLYLCSYMHDMGLYRNRIVHLLNEIKPMAFSRIPFLHCNRLTLMSAVVCVANSTNDSDWYEYLSLLHRSFSFDKILDRETGYKQTFLSDGLLGIYCLAYEYNKNCVDNSLKLLIPNKLQDRLLKGFELMDIEEYKQRGQLGLDGILGILLFNKLTSIK